jgi:hypothetical protein
MAEDDYAWIDLYLHNQYQGAVSDIGDENSQYWINKFGDLIGGIGKVIAIVTDWESPVMLSRIWCLFELNAAIEMHAELRFVAAAAQQHDLSLNLNAKFRCLDLVVGSIDVRNCDAKRPHEIQDKAIFLGKLRGIEDEVNDKLRKEMRQWLRKAAEGVIYRTDPYRLPLDDAAMAIEAADIGDCWFSRRYRATELRRRTTGGARLTRLLEWFPQLATGVRLVGMCLWGSSFYALGWWWSTEQPDDVWALLGLTDLFLIFFFTTSGKLWLLVLTSVSSPILWWKVQQATHSTTALLAPLVFFVGYALLGVGMALTEHQIQRQLRQPPPFGAFAAAHIWPIQMFIMLVGYIIVPACLWYLNGWRSFVTGILGGVNVSTGLVAPLSDGMNGVTARASLCTKVGWLRLALGQTELAVETFAEAKTELEKRLGLYSQSDPIRCWIPLAGHARALCEAGRHEEALSLKNNVDEEVLRMCSSDIIRKTNPEVFSGYWKLHRANMAAAIRAHDSEVLALLIDVADEGCGVPAGCRPIDGIVGMHDNRGGIEAGLPEWDEFLERMAACTDEEAAINFDEEWEEVSEGVRRLAKPGAAQAQWEEFCAKSDPMWYPLEAFVEPASLQVNCVATMASFEQCVAAIDACEVLGGADDDDVKKYADSAVVVLEIDDSDSTVKIKADHAHLSAGALRYAWLTYRSATVEHVKQRVAKLDNQSQQVGNALESLGLPVRVEGEIFTRNTNNCDAQRARLLAAYFEHPAWNFNSQDAAAAFVDTHNG